ncbi:MAG: lytic transglycosylase, partial [Epsilonproteobacteria bacterium]|nr:lytic transglycosylase [Campylobacterota bacterium]NPA65123.1 LysM peptidoglycan-binding domain-containing protein [Campylobacterota bacterium]
NVPDVFLFLAMAESNFISHAKSGKQAVGIWQFLAPTARKYGLRVDEYVDERKDPYKATNAAIKYLKRLHKMFGKWYLAALAYNAGEGTLQRAIKRAGTDDVMVLLDPKKKYLPKESRKYLAKIVMLALISNDKRYRVSSELAYILTRGEEYDILPVKVKGAELLDYVAERIKLRSSFLRQLNPHIKRGFTPPDVKRYTIYIPKLKYKEFVANYKPSNSYRNFVVYKVKKGDSLYAIAKKFRLRVSSIKKFNHLRSNLLRPGQKLILPVAKKRKRIYKVRPGDTIIKIAKRFGVDPKKLKAWNDKKSNFIKAGEELVILY